MTTTEQPRIVSPRLLFRSFAVAEMFTWAGLITALILRTFDVANLVPIAGGIHGFVFLCYSATTIFVWVNQGWRLRLGLTGLLLAIVPFATVPFEIVVDAKGCWPAIGGSRPDVRNRTGSSNRSRPGCCGMCFSRSSC
ncbi:DUF3817 domain-containing protein [Leucobacter sp. USHLN154]|uniref:DUF3817 domain-containing protein n=1 Tax=Leucobacter sp. USHLN154 TaxID=3081269 RepID=UPI00301A8F8D